jgi:hypothetical protein
VRCKPYPGRTLCHPHVYSDTSQVSPAIARQLIEQEVLKSAQVIALSATDYISVIDDLAARQLAGGVTYDALLAKAAANSAADKLLTLNPKDFHRVWPAGASIITAV